MVLSPRCLPSPPPLPLLQVLAAGFVDAWRAAHPDTAQYTYWSYRFDARANNKGWRIDYTLVSKDAAHLVVRTFWWPVVPVCSLGVLECGGLCRMRVLGRWNAA